MRSLRSRITALATLVLTIVLVLAAVLIVSQVDRQIRNDLAEQNEETLTDIVAAIEIGDAPENIRLPLASDGTEFIISKADGTWVNSTIRTIVSEEVSGPDLPVPDLPGTGLAGSESIIVFDEFLVDPATMESSTRTAISPAGVQYTVDAISPTAIVDRAVGQVRTVLWFVIPVLALLFGLLMWWLAGRMLRPVDQLTAKARRIRTDTLNERLDEPGTGDEIDRLAQTLNSMLERLDRGAQAQAQFVSDASHELRSPLTVILGESELAAGSPTPERLAAANAKTVEHAHQMRVLIADLLELAQAGETTPRRGDVDLEDIVRSACADIGCNVDTTGLSPQRILGEASALTRVFRNLLENAARHSRERVAVGSRVTDGNIEVSVDDDGPGVAEEDRHLIFERFSRADESRRRTDGGTGLGLAIAKAIVEAHEGSIDVTDSPSLGGARFRVVLPIHRSG